jgi:hypothetical protein
MAVALCRSCNASIVWARTRQKGKFIPLDAEPDALGNLVIGPPWGADPPTVDVVKPGDNVARDRYTSHFATCKNAALHRRPR